jgi:hypothetical protein
MGGRRGAGACLAAALAIAGPVMGQKHPDPDWPCVQRKVPELAVAQMWGGPPPDDAWQDDDALGELARSLAPRRVPVEEAAAAAAEQVAGLPPEARAKRLADLFAAVLDRINAERGAVIAGIGRFARHQAQDADRVGALQQELVDLEAAPAAERDEARVAALREQLVWETRVYRERAQSLTYVCETPVILEQRAFALGRAIAARLPG